MSEQTMANEIVQTVPESSAENVNLANVTHSPGTHQTKLGAHQTCNLTQKSSYQVSLAAERGNCQYRINGNFGSLNQGASTPWQTYNSPVRIENLHDSTELDVNWQ